MAESGKQKFTYYHYDPSLAGDVAFIVLFLIATIIHVTWIVKKKTYYFIPFAVGCALEAIGYAGRAIQATQEEDEWKQGPYILQALAILLGPTLFAASIYMVLGRMIRMLEATHHSIIRVNWLTKIFVAGDILCIMVQGAGGGILTSADTKSEQDMGNNVVLGGLGIQIVVFGLFMITTVIFHVRMIRHPTARSFSVTTPWTRLIWVLYITSALIMVRSLFRMIEYAMGWDGVLMQSELYLFLLDGLLMVLVTAAFAFYHPGRVLVGYKKGKGDVEDYSTSDGFSGPESRGGSQYAMTGQPGQPGPAL